VWFFSHSGVRFASILRMSLCQMQALCTKLYCVARVCSLRGLVRNRYTLCSLCTLFHMCMYCRGLRASGLWYCTDQTICFLLQLSTMCSAELHSCVDTADITPLPRNSRFAISHATLQQRLDTSAQAQRCVDKLAHRTARKWGFSLQRPLAWPNLSQYCVVFDLELLFICICTRASAAAACRSGAGSGCVCR
jgi:hypothetical protein